MGKKLEECFQFINLSDVTEIPEGYEIRPEDQIESRLKGLWTSKFLLSKETLKLYLEKGQGKTSKRQWINGLDLKKRLEGKPVIGAPVLDFYLKNPRLIPKEFKGQMVLFWGTIYCWDQRLKEQIILCVRSLLWDPEHKTWDSRFVAIFSSFDDTCPALIYGNKV